jgi:protein-S-isoprenylcysteine O-methyltransferase Ste14
MAIAINLKATPPPLICLATLLISVAFNAIWPPVSIQDHLRYVFGSLLIFGSLLAMRSILVKFRCLNTTFDVRKSPSVLIKVGLYRLSRNPLYVALVVLFIGLGVVMSNLWVPILLVPATAIIVRYVIPEEERRLESAFGDRYRAYKSQVRRWL